MKPFRWGMLAAAAPLALAGCGSFGNAMTAHTDVVAQAAGHELKVQEAAGLLAPNPQIPAEVGVVQALSDLWVDYTLLATAAAEDTSLAMVDLNRLTEPDREQAVILKLRDQVVRPDTTFTDAELQEAWNTEGPGAEIRARHILLRIPTEATTAQRDSVRRQAEALRAQAAGGADFAALAGQHSEDPGSAQQGGDLGYFGRGRMVAPFEEAAFKLQPGQVSQVVESPFGYHVIKVEDRRQQPLGEQREPFRQFLVQKAVQDAERGFIEGIEKSAGLELRPGAAKVAKEVAAQPNLRLRGRQGERVVATYKGGELTTAELADALREAPPQALAQFAAATDEQITEVIQQVARKEILLQEAARRRVALTPAQQDSIRTQTRQGIQQLLRQLGLTRANLPKGAGTKAAVEAQVKRIVEGAVNGTIQVPPLGRLGQALRGIYDVEINEGNFPKVVSALQAQRPAQPAPPAGQMPQMPPQGMPPQGAPQGPPQGQGAPQGAPSAPGQQP